MKGVIKYGKTYNFITNANANNIRVTNANERAGGFGAIMYGNSFNTFTPGLWQVNASFDFRIIVRVVHR